MHHKCISYTFCCSSRWSYIWYLLFAWLIAASNRDRNVKCNFTIVFPNAVWIYFFFIWLKFTNEWIYIVDDKKYIIFINSIRAINYYPQTDQININHYISYLRWNKRNYECLLNGIFECYLVSFIIVHILRVTVW